MPSNIELQIYQALCVAESNGFGFIACENVTGSTDRLFLLSFETRLFPRFESKEESIRWRHALELPLLELVPMAEDEHVLYVSVPYHYTPHAPRIIQYAIDQGFSVIVRDGLDVSYEPGERFDPHTHEEKFVQRRGHMVHLFSDRWKYYCSWNWCTPAGKAFHASLMEKASADPFYDPTDEEMCNIFDWGAGRVLREYKLYRFAEWWPVPF